MFPGLCLRRVRPHLDVSVSETRDEKSREQVEIVYRFLAFLLEKRNAFWVFQIDSFEP